jgi:PAS domain S-box-containing protein
MRTPLRLQLPRWLAPPPASGPEAEHVQTTVWAAALALVGATFVAALVFPLGGSPRYGPAAPLIPLAGSLVALVLARRGRAEWAGALVIAVFLLGLSLGLLQAGTLLSPGSGFYAIAILLAGLVFGVRGVLLLTLLVGVLLIGLDSLFETPLGRSLHVPERANHPPVLSWLALPFLVGVIVAASVGRLRRREAEAIRSEAALAESESRYRALVENAPIGVVVFDDRLRITAFNPEACRMLGAESPGAMLGRPARDLPTAALPQVDEGFSRVLERGERVSFEAEWTSSFGVQVRSRLYGAPLRDGAGQIVGAVVIMADISEQRRLEEQLFQSQKLEAVGRLAGGIAHDFNNQLTVILAGAESLSLGVGPELAGEVDQIASAAQRSAELTQQLLAFGRRQLLAPRVLDLNTIVAETDALLRRTLGEGVEIETVLAAGLWSVRADPTQLQTALVNLATNARDAMNRQGRLTIETANVHLDRSYVKERDVPPGQHVMLAVTDDGAGMDAETRAQVFEPFFTTKPPGEGTGLGLSMVHGFVSQSHGVINVDSEPGQGATFRIYLPRVEATPDAKPVAPQPAARGGAERLLVAEDDPAVRAMLVRVLRGAGYEVLEAPDGEAASELAARTAQLDLLVTDLVMPRLGGIELARRLQETRSALRVLYLSGYAEDGVLRRAGLRLGSSLLAKPFSPAELLGRVREALDG